MVVMDCSLSSSSLLCFSAVSLTLLTLPPPLLPQFVHQYIESPFTSLPNEQLFNVARYLLCSVGGQGQGPKGQGGSGIPAPRLYGISRMNILFTLAKQAKNEGAYKLSRIVFDRIR